MRSLTTGVAPQRRPGRPCVSLPGSRGSLPIRTAHILICDDEPELREMLGAYLEKRGYSVQLASDGQMLDALIAETERVDVVLLDINMPGEDGLSILRRLRDQHDFALLMLTAANKPIDKVLGFEMGADACHAKPVDLREVEARIRAVLRRAAHRAAPRLERSEPTRVGFGRFEMDLAAAKLFDKEGAEVPLTAMEFRLLKVFVQNPGRVLGRGQLLELAHDRGRAPYGRSIDTRISRLRRKIEVAPGKPQLIRTVRGIGYVFDPTG